VRLKVSAVGQNGGESSGSGEVAQICNLLYRRFVTCLGLRLRVLALTKAHFPNDTYYQLIQHVTTGTDSLASLAGQCTTGGRLNRRKALGIEDSNAE